MQFETFSSHVCVHVRVCLCVYMCVSACGWVRVSVPGEGICKVSSLLSCRVDMQPTDMHSLLLQLQPQLLQPLQPLTATGRYGAERAHATHSATPLSSPACPKAALRPCASCRPALSVLCCAKAQLLGPPCSHCLGLASPRPHFQLPSLPFHRSTPEFFSCYVQE